MRKSPLKKEDKERIEKLLVELELIPPMAGQIIFNLDAQGKVANAEMGKVVWR